jgi:hypothetical protein
VLSHSQSQQTPEDASYAYAVWQFITEHVPEHKKRVSGTDNVMAVQSLSPTQQHQLLELTGRWYKQVHSVRSLAAAAAAPANTSR